MMRIVNHLLLVTCAFYFFDNTYAMDRNRTNCPSGEQEKVLFLHDAALRGDLNAVQLLTNAGVDVRSVNIGMNILHCAVRGRNPHVVELLLSHLSKDHAAPSGGVDSLINAPDLFGNTPLILAVKSYLAFRTEEKEQYYSLAYASIVSMLKQCGADINVKNKKLKGGLHYALKGSSVRIIDQFLDGVSEEIFEAIVDKIIKLRYRQIQRPKQLMRVFQDACKEGWFSIAKYLLETEAVIPGAWDWRETRAVPKVSSALDFASAWGQGRVVELLIHHGVSLMQSDNQPSCLHHAIQGYSEQIKFPGNYFVTRCVHSDVVKTLLEKGAAVNACDTFRQTPLYLACQDGNSTAVRLLIDKGADIDAITYHQATPLLAILKSTTAAVKDRISIIESLHKKGVHFDSLFTNGLTVLHVAILQKLTEEVINTLLACGAFIDMGDSRKRTPLHCAILEDATAIAFHLINCGAKISLPEQNGMTPLHVACGKGNLAIVEKLISMGATVNCVDKLGFSPLHLAVVDNIAGTGIPIYEDDEVSDSFPGERKDFVNDFSSLEMEYSLTRNLNNVDSKNLIVSRLIDAGANVNISARKHWTPLLLAALVNRIDIMEILIQHKAQKSVTEDGWSLLHVAMLLQMSEVDSTLRYLLENGANVHIETLGSSVPLHWAAERDLQMALIALADKGANIDACDRDGWTPLHRAASMGAVNAANFLLMRGANTTVFSHDGFTPLHVAAQRCRLETMKLLLNHKENNVNVLSQSGIILDHTKDRDVANTNKEASLNKRTEDQDLIRISKSNYSALHLVIQSDANEDRIVEAVELLLDKGADPNAITAQSHTPLDLATREGLSKVVTLLKSTGLNLKIVDSQELHL